MQRDRGRACNEIKVLKDRAVTDRDSLTVTHSLVVEADRSSNGAAGPTYGDTRRRKRARH